MENIADLIHAASAALAAEDSPATLSVYLDILERAAGIAGADQRAEALAVIERIKAALEPAGAGDPWAGGGWPGGCAADLG